MTDDDDKLDLSAWEAPPPPVGVADAVLARMAGGEVAAAIAEAPVPPRRRALVIVGVAAACLAAAAGVFLVVRGTHRAAPTSGQLVAQRAQTLSLDTVRGELDGGASITWRRQSGALRVEQRAGAATWRVDGDERLMIDAGAMVASVEATGASLRVEVKMNQTDARVLGGAALTAAAVSLVTVIVYNGHVKVSGSQGQPTVIVQPGSTYTVMPPAPAPVVGAKVDLASNAVLALLPGESATIHTPELPVLVELDGGTACSYIVDGMVQPGAVATLGDGQHAYVTTCGTTSTQGTIVVTIDRADRALVEPMPNPIVADGRHYRVSFQTTIPSITVKGGPGTLHVTRGALERTYDSNTIPGGDLAPGSYEYWFTGGGERSTLTIDPDPRALVAQLSRVTWGPSVRVEGIGLATSTLSVAGVQASHGGRFSVNVAPTNSAVALRFDDTHHGIHYYVVRGSTAPTPTKVATVKSPCDADALKTTGMEAINMGEHAKALAAFEASLACKDDPYVLQLAFMESCASGNEAKANEYFPLLTPAQRTKFEQICIRQRPPVKLVHPADQAGVLKVYSTIPAKIFIDGVDTGKTTPVERLDLPVGKHKVTYAIGEDRFTYPVIIRAGATETISKDLQ